MALGAILGNMSACLDAKDSIGTLQIALPPTAANLTRQQLRISSAYFCCLVCVGELELPSK